jgi:ABC-type multidrug transport system ATPase subunit
MTGVFEPSGGNAYVSGYSITNNMDKVQECIGYCPQFDLLWNDLTVEDHLYLYSRLKNVSSAEIKQNVNKTLKETNLEKFRSLLVRELSGGMKRRLSVGISLVGNPSVVFLDEPSTGLDPENKRAIWEILATCKADKCIVLSTHLMEEAEVLSDRIGIITQGQLKYIGNKYNLKKRHGSGFKLTFHLAGYSYAKTHKLSEVYYIERNKHVNEFVMGLFPNAKVSESYKDTISFEVWSLVNV